LNSFGGGGHLYAYDIAKETWSLLRTPGLGIIAMSYSPELDVLYVYHAENGDRVSTYTPHGVRIGHVKLERGLAGGGMSGAFEDNTYIRPVGPYVALTTPARTSEDGKKRRLPKILLADPTTGEVLYVGVMRLQADRRDVSEKELDEWWDALLEADKATANSLVWKTASGQDRAVAYLDKRVARPKVVDEAQVLKLIEALGAEKFEDRQNASGKLASLGSAAEPILKKAVDHPTAEVRSRVRQLLKAFEGDEPTNPHLRREFYAVTALGRIGTPKAVEALQRIGQVQATSPLGRHAVKAIETLNSDEETIEANAGKEKERRRRAAPGAEVL
jgi:hypothetical protein